MPGTAASMGESLNLKKKATYLYHSNLIINKTLILFGIRLRILFSF